MLIVKRTQLALLLFSNFDSGKGQLSPHPHKQWNQNWIRRLPLASLSLSSIVE